MARPYCSDGTALDWHRCWRPLLPQRRPKAKVEFVRCAMHSRCLGGLQWCERNAAVAALAPLLLMPLGSAACDSLGFDLWVPQLPLNMMLECTTGKGQCLHLVNPLLQDHAPCENARTQSLRRPVIDHAKPYGSFTIISWSFQWHPLLSYWKREYLVTTPARPLLPGPASPPAWLTPDPAALPAAGAPVISTPLGTAMLAFAVNWYTHACQSHKRPHLCICAPAEFQVSNTTLRPSMPWHACLSECSPSGNI